MGFDGRSRRIHDCVAVSYGLHRPPTVGTVAPQEVQLSENRDSVAREIAGMMRSSLSRRRILQAAGITGVAAVAAACGASGDTGSATASAAPAAADLSDSDKTVIWSNWPGYMDSNEKTGARPSLDAFVKQTGIAATYTEDINDNNEFYAKVRTQLEQGQPIDRDIVVLTDWMAALWIESGYAQKLDKASMPNASANVIDKCCVRSRSRILASLAVRLWTLWLE